MVKNNIIVVILLVSAVSIYAQNVQVTGKEDITAPEQGEFYYPRFSNNGSEIVFTGDGYKGLWLYEDSNHEIRKLNDYEGAGNGPVFTKDDRSLVFRAYRFENMKRISSLYSQDLLSGMLTAEIEESKNLYPPLKGSSKSINIVQDGKAGSLYGSLNKSVSNEENKFVYVDNSKIVLVKDGEKKIIEPLGEGNYLWTSISPEGTMMLFTKAGSGTFVSDLDGNILYELGKANYPVWAKDGKWILYMNDADDGNKFTSSEIELINLDTMKRFNLTHTDDVIEMYPDYSTATDEVVYHTTDGQIIKLKLKFN